MSLSTKTDLNCNFTYKPDPNKELIKYNNKIGDHAKLIEQFMDTFESFTANPDFLRAVAFSDKNVRIQLASMMSDIQIQHVYDSDSGKFVVENLSNVNTRREYVTEKHCFDHVIRNISRSKAQNGIDSLRIPEFEYKSENARLTVDNNLIFTNSTSIGQIDKCDRKYNCNDDAIYREGSKIFLGSTLYEPNTSNPIITFVVNPDVIHPLMALEHKKWMESKLSKGQSLNTGRDSISVKMSALATATHGIEIAYVSEAWRDRLFYNVKEASDFFVSLMKRHGIRPVSERSKGN